MASIAEESNTTGRMHPSIQRLTIHQTPLQSGVYHLEQLLDAGNDGKTFESYYE